MDYAVENVKKMLADDKPVFGICLGHQLLAEAIGGEDGVAGSLKRMNPGLVTEVTHLEHARALALDEAPGLAVVESFPEAELGFREGEGESGQGEPGQGPEADEVARSSLGGCHQNRK